MVGRRGAWVRKRCSSMSVSLEALVSSVGLTSSSSSPASDRLTAVACRWVRLSSTFCRAPSNPLTSGLSCAWSRQDDGCRVEEGVVSSRRPAESGSGATDLGDDAFVSYYGSVVEGVDREPPLSRCRDWLLVVVVVHVVADWTSGGA